MTSPPAPRVRARRHPALLWHLSALILSALFLVPLASMLVGSLRLPGLPPPRGIEWLPKPLAWSNYPETFGLVDKGRYIVNTFVVELLAVPITLLVASWAGFALSQLPRRLAGVIITAALLFLLL